MLNSSLATRYSLLATNFCDKRVQKQSLNFDYAEHSKNLE